MSLRTDLGRVRGLGAGRSGPHHWWQQRLTAIALVLLGLWLLASLAGGAAATHDSMVGWVRQPLVAVLLVLGVVTLFHHARLGLQVVIEDYVHSAGNKVAATIALTFFTLGGTVAGVFAILKIAFGA